MGRTRKSFLGMAFTLTTPSSISAGSLRARVRQKTFDMGGLEATLNRLATGYGVEDIAVPVFDREIEPVARWRTADRA